MLTFVVSQVTKNNSGPVVHLSEASGAGAKIELYLPQGYDVPGVGDVFDLDQHLAEIPKSAPTPKST
jgi:hypothetical protein